MDSNHYNRSWRTLVAGDEQFFLKSLDGVLGIRTWGRRMVGSDETTELWRPDGQLEMNNCTCPVVNQVKNGCFYS